MFIELVGMWRVHRIVSSENGKGYFLQKKSIFFAEKFGDSKKMRTFATQNDKDSNLTAG